MEHNAIVVWVPVMAVGLPIALTEVHLHVALDESLAFDHQQGVTEIGAGSYAGATRIQDLNPCAGLAVESTVACRAALPQAGQLLFGDRCDRVRAG